MLIRYYAGAEGRAERMRSYVKILFCNLCAIENGISRLEMQSDGTEVNSSFFAVRAREMQKPEPKTHDKVAGERQVKYRNLNSMRSWMSKENRRENQCGKYFSLCSNYKTILVMLESHSVAKRHKKLDFQNLFLLQAVLIIVAFPRDLQANKQTSLFVANKLCFIKFISDVLPLNIKFNFLLLACQQSDWILQNPSRQ